MRFSLNFIKELVDVDMPAHKLAALLTMAGMEVEHFEKTGNDWVFDIEVTTNRYDWLSMIGIAKEISTSLEKKCKVQYPRITKTPLFKDKQIIIEDSTDCPFYIGRVLHDVCVSESPLRLKTLLVNCKINPVNNVVDITNYCMLKWGNPLHAFDMDKIEGDVYIRRAQHGEPFVGIDGKERVLDKQNLVIADARKVIALAGVMGAKNTEVDETTKSIFLEGAVFSPLTTRRSRRAAAVDTESSYRFERMVSADYLEAASEEAGRLIVKEAGAVFTGIQQAGKKPLSKRKNIIIDTLLLNNYLGVQVSKKEVKKIIYSLGCAVKDVSLTKLSVAPAPFRFDIQREVDVYEEFSRIYGYDNIPCEIPFFPPQHSEERFYEFKIELKNILSLLGLKEIITYSIEGEDELSMITGNEKEFIPTRNTPPVRPQSFIRIENPLRKQENVMRPSLLLGMIKSIRHNLNRGQKNIRFFEIANAYGKNENGFSETPFMSMGASGPKQEFFYLKGALEKLFCHLNISVSFQPASFVNFTNAIEVCAQGKSIGFLGKLDDKIKKIFDVRDDVFFAQLDVQLLQSLRNDTVFMPFSAYPAIWRDLSIALRCDRKFGDIECVIRNKGRYIADMRVTDTYEGKDIPSDYSAFTLRVFYQSKEKTLTTQEVDDIHNEIRQSVAHQEGIILR